MSRKSRVLLFIVILVLLVSFVGPGIALASSSCGSSYVVQRGDTLSRIAVLCGTTVSALRQANPGLGRYIYAGQMLVIPDGSGYVPGPAYGGTYTVRWGDTFRKIAARLGYNVNDLIAANPQVWNPNLIYPGQVIYLPGSTSYNPGGNYDPSGWQSTYTVQWGDTLRKIAARYGTSVSNLMALNPQIWSPNVIYAGQVIRIQ